MSLQMCFESSFFVAPFAGAWIEIEEREKVDVVIDVAPFAGAWIEILDG